jgi:undecaprenyl-diphosphatase
MMTNSQALILGIVQGLTEYLPVSSSAHLVLVPQVLGWHVNPAEAFVFDVLVQLGTMIGVFCYFFTPIKEVIVSVLKGLALRRPLHDSNAQLGWLVALASIPAAILGFTFKTQLSEYFSSPLASCYFLILTAVFLFGAEWLNLNLRKQAPTKKDALFIGLAQGLALFPGVSRSGSTIAAGMLCGLNRIDAARFSFLMSIPVMIGASLVASFDLIHDAHLINHLLIPLAIGFISAALTGYLVIKWFMDFLSTQRLFIFASYCLGIGLAGALYFGH